MEKKLIGLTTDEIILKNLELQMRLNEAEEALNAIRNGEVDAIIVSGQTGEKIFTLTSADMPYRIILEEMGEGAVIVTSQGNILYCNQRFSEIFASAVRPIVGMNILNIISETERSKLARLLEEGLKKRTTGKISFFRESNSCTLHLNFSLRPLPQGIEGDICIIVTDITRMQQFQDHLQEMVNERTLEIEKVNEQLRELNTSKNKFLNIIAHDLRNPFTSLIGASDVLIENVDTLDRGKIKKLVKTLKDASENGYSILQNLLEWSRSQTGMLNITHARIDLNDLIEEQIRSMSQMSENKDILIQYASDKNARIFSDRNILNTILRNLLSNSIKFTQRGGKIYVSVALVKDMMTISVKDTGIGISPKNIKKLFNLETVHTQRGTENERGTGLGLKLCKELVDKLKGKIRVKSKVSHGSEFMFSIPVNEAVSK